MEQPLQPGARLANYEIRSLIGQGTFSRVYAACDLHAESQPQRALLESILRGDAEERELRQRTFQRAAEVLEKVDDPAIPKIHRFFQEGDRFYIVQELIEGWDYSKHLNGEKPQLSPDEVERVLQESLSGLAPLHGARIVHRDIKPSNLLRRASDGSTAIVDFGSACDLSQMAVTATQMPGVSQQQPGRTQIYTPGYAHPDQREGLVAATPQWDLYSLARTIVALCLGSDPPWQQPWAIEGLGLSPRTQGLLREMLADRECRLLDARDALAYELPAAEIVATPAPTRQRQLAPLQPNPWRRWLAIFVGTSCLSAAATVGILYFTRASQRAANGGDRCPNYLTSDAGAIEPARGFAVRFEYPETASPGSSTLEVRRDGRLLARASDSETLGVIQIASLANGTSFPAGEYRLKLFVPGTMPYEEEVALDTDSVVYLGRLQPLEGRC